MGARNNKALREPKNKNAKAAALNKKFKKKPCSFCQQKVTYIDYKDIATLRKYISDRGKIRAYRCMHTAPAFNRNSGKEQP
jgi:small subunit ribosomal protein S18